MNFVLVHGGMVTSSVWNRLAPLLMEGANRVVAPTLPGRVGNPLDHADVTVEGCAQAVIEKMDRAGAKEATLVSHSSNGAILIAIAGLIPERIQHLVFLTCVIPPDGKRVMDALWAEQLPDMQKLIDAGDTTVGGGNLTAKEQTADDPQDPELRVPEPLSLFATPVSLAPLKAGIPMTFLKLLRDEALTPDMQDGFIANLRSCGPCDVIELNTDHNPMLSAPELMEDILTTLR